MLKKKKRIIFFELKQWSHLKFLKKFVNVNFAKKTISNCTYNYVKVMTEILTLRTYSNEIYFIWLVAIQDRLLFKIHLRSLYSKETMNYWLFKMQVRQQNGFICTRIFCNQRNEKTFEIQHCAPQREVFIIFSSIWDAQIHQGKCFAPVLWNYWRHTWKWHVF